MIPVRTALELTAIDRHTIQKKGISGLDLMELAAHRFCEALLETSTFSSAAVCCGPGNNGGDGLAISRILKGKGIEINTYVFETANSYSPDYLENLERLKGIKPIFNIEEEPEFKGELLIDALFGYGLNRPLEGKYADTVQKINFFPGKVISVDMPSGIPAEPSFELHPGISVAADFCFTFHCPKLSLLLPYSNHFCSAFRVLDIDLIDEADASMLVLEQKDIRGILRDKGRFVHKHSRGSVLIIGGSMGKTGSVILSSMAAMRSGCGVLYAHVPEVVIPALSVALPEAMYRSSGDTRIVSWNQDERCDAIGIGPGLGFDEKSIAVFKEVLACGKPLIIDADALRILADKDWFDKIPHGSILTPHEGEFKALVGPWRDDMHKLDLLKEFSRRYHCVTVLKGAYTVISAEGRLYFNLSGHPAMATAGSGDVLLGMLASYRAQGYSAMETAMISVYLHGLAAQVCLEYRKSETLLASDITRYIGSAGLRVHGG